MLTTAVLLSILALAGYGLWCLSHGAFVAVFGCGVAVLSLFGCCFVYAMLRQHRAVRAKAEEQHTRVKEALDRAARGLPTRPVDLDAIKNAFKDAYIGPNPRGLH